MPAIVSARSQNAGHSFVIDAGKRTRLRTRNWYRWIGGTDDTPEMTPAVDSYVDTLYSTFRDCFKMNWGWEDTSYDDIWYSSSGSWTPNNYLQNKYSLYNFRAL